MYCFCFPLAQIPKCTHLPLRAGSKGAAVGRYSFIFVTDFFLDWFIPQKQKTYANPKLSLHDQIVTMFTQLFASIMDFCFCNRFSNIIRECALCQCRFQHQRKTICLHTFTENKQSSEAEEYSLYVAFHCMRAEREQPTGEMSTNETSIKLWWYTSIHQHTWRSPLSLFFKR